MNTSPEVTLFSGLFVMPEWAFDAIELINADDFEDPDWRALFRAITYAAMNAEPVDVVNIAAILRRDGMGESKALDVVERANNGGMIEQRGYIKHYAKLIHEKTKHKRVVKLMEAASSAGETQSADEILSTVLPEIWNIQTERQDGQLTPLTEVIRGELGRLFDVREGSIDGSGIFTGIDVLDNTTGGLRPGELWMVGALPGRGKTAFATQIALNAAGRGIPTLFQSLEMSGGQLIQRMIGTEVGVSGVRNPRILSDVKWKQASEFAAELAGWPLFIDDASSLSALVLSSRARMAIKQHGIKLLIVDYLQLIKGVGRELRERVGDAANVLRQLAKDTGCPVLALSQLRRPGNLNDRPTMIELKESGDIEAHSHVVLLLYTPMGEDGNPSGEDEIIIGKQRNGPLGTLPVFMDTRTLTFRPRETGGLNG